MLRIIALLALILFASACGQREEAAITTEAELRAELHELRVAVQGAEHEANRALKYARLSEISAAIERIDETEAQALEWSQQALDLGWTRSQVREAYIDINIERILDGRVALQKQQAVLRSR